MKSTAFRQVKLPACFCIAKPTLAAMKFTFLLLTVACMQISARGLGQTVNLHLQNSKIETAFKVISQQTGYQFIYTQEDLQGCSPVSCDLEHVSLQVALDSCLKGQPLKYSIEEKYVVVQPKLNNDNYKKLIPVPLHITGRVVSTEGNPIQGATVTASLSHIATSTDKDGNFILENLRENESLIITHVGYRQEVIDVGNKREFLIRLQILVNSLDETIVVAYGKTTNRLSTGSIEKVDGAVINRQPVANVLGALEGQVPGMVVTQTSGVPSASYKVQIRGQNSILQGTEPLYVIDGVPFLAAAGAANQLNTAAQLSPLNILSPSEIESVEVLKDADATSLYGSRGANGVILITTKSAQPGKTTIDLTMNTGFSRITRTMNMLDTRHYIAMRNEAFANDGISPDPSIAPDIFNWDTTRNLNLRKLLTGGTAGFWNGQLSLSGGSAATRFLFSAGYTRQTTVFPGDMHDNRVNVRTNLNHYSTDHRYHFSFTSAYSSQQSNLSSYDLSNWVNLPPHIHLYDSSGKLNWEESGNSFYDLGLSNPMAYLLQKYNGQFNNLLSNLQTSYNCRNGLSFTINLGYNLLVTDETRVNPSTSLDPASGLLPHSTFSNRQQWNWIAEPQISYDHHWGSLKLNVLTGATYQYSRDNTIYIDATNYSSDLQLESVNAAGSVSTNNNLNEFKYISGYGRVNLNYSDQFLLNLSARRDGSSRFGPGKQFAGFGSAGLAWIFSKAKWFSSSFPFISFGKIRASYGTAGNDNIGNYQFLDTWINTNTNYQGNPGLIPSRLYNPDYSWEINHKAEIGLDLGFLNDRLLFSLQIYNNRCGNQLIGYTLPAIAGFTSVNKNLDALVQNRGVDIRLSFKSIQKENVEWTSQLTVSSGRNKLVRFPGLSQSSYATAYVIGQPLSVRPLYQYKGVDPATGVYLFEDINQDGLLNFSDKTGHKNTEPQFYGGISNNIRIKNFEISLFFEFRKQTGLNYLHTQLYNVPGYDYRNQPQVVWNRWQHPGDQKSIQRFTANYSSEAYTKAASYLGDSEAIYGDASFIRCKNLTISWVLRKSRLKKIGAQQLRFNVALQNLFTLTNYQGADPENQNLYALPPLRTMTAGLQLTF